ncbi:Uncharacterised protein [Slackia heliotrinireducens]|nr:Uncharacterised protein [Slackia heliotrinireducens]
MSSIPAYSDTVHAPVTAAAPVSACTDAAALADAPASAATSVCAWVPTVMPASVSAPISTMVRTRVFATAFTRVPTWMEMGIADRVLACFSTVSIHADIHVSATVPAWMEIVGDEHAPACSRGTQYPSSCGGCRFFGHLLSERALTAPRRRSPEAPERPHHGRSGASPWPIRGSILTNLGFHFGPIYEGKMKGIGHAASFPTVHRTAPEASSGTARGIAATAPLCTCTETAVGSSRPHAAGARGRDPSRTPGVLAALRARSIRPLADGRPDSLGTPSVTYSHEWCDSLAGRPHGHAHACIVGQPVPPIVRQRLAPAVPTVKRTSRHLGGSCPECRLTNRHRLFVAPREGCGRGPGAASPRQAGAYYATPACPHSVPIRYRACVGCEAKPHVNAGRRGAETRFPCLTCGDAVGILYYADEGGRKRRLRLAHGRDGGVPRTPGKGARSAVGTSSASTLAPRVLMKGTVM